MAGLAASAAGIAPIVQIAESGQTRQEIAQQETTVGIAALAAISSSIYAATQACRVPPVTVPVAPVVVPMATQPVQP